MMSTPEHVLILRIHASTIEISNHTGDLVSAIRPTSHAISILPLEKKKIVLVFADVNRSSKRIVGGPRNQCNRSGQIYELTNSKTVLDSRSTKSGQIKITIAITLCTFRLYRKA